MADNKCASCGHTWSEDGGLWCPRCKANGREPSAVDHPSHYNAGKLEVIEVIRDQGMHIDFCLGNALKYIMRAKHKGKFTEDLKKARWYLDYLIQLAE